MPRLDIYLTEKGLANTRSMAQNLIKMKKVTVNGKFPQKTGEMVTEGDDIVVNNDINASIGCYKLEEAIAKFNLANILQDKVCLDIGASNGGFTSVLLKYGASKVYAVDIGLNMLSYELTNNTKVVIRDTTNAKDMLFDQIGERVAIITIDVSFIGLDKILPNMIQFMDEDCVIIALLKPQFEVGAKNLTKSGLVKSVKIIEKLIDNYTSYIDAIGLNLCGSCPVPKLFDKKNLEFLLCIKRKQ